MSQGYPLLVHEKLGSSEVGWFYRQGGSDNKSLPFFYGLIFLEHNSHKAAYWLFRLQTSERIAPWKFLRV